MTPAEIRNLRNALGMSWRQFADECRVSNRTARYWAQENKGTSPGRFALMELNRLKAIADQQAETHIKDDDR
jgi:DNA-binding transcriptional regulator YiaG